MAVLIISLMVIGFNMQSVADDLKPFLYFLHKAVGVSVFGLILCRILLKLLSDAPAQHAKSLLNCISKTIHFALYFLMLLMPLSGYLMSSASGRAVVWFFDINVPLLCDVSIALSKFMHTVHSTGAYIIMVCIILHICGFFKHLFWDKQNLLRRIW